MWDQTEVIQKSLEDAKQIFINAVNLTFTDHSGPLALTTDASKFAAGAQLDWTDNGGHEEC